MTYGPRRTASAICDGRRVVERRRHGAGDVAARRDDLMAAGAVLGEELLALRQAAALRLRGSGRPALAERGDVGDERVDLRGRAAAGAPWLQAERFSGM